MQLHHDGSATVDPTPEPPVPPVITDPPERDPEPPPIIPEPDPTHTPVVPEPEPEPATEEGPQRSSAG